MNRMVLLGFLLGACSGNSPTDGGDDTSVVFEAREAVTDGGTWQVSYVPVPDPIPATDNFELLLTINQSETGESVVDAEITVVASMPAHNHFMNTTPVVTANGDGTYGVSGMQFHMSGHWQIDVTVELDDVAETALFHTECCE